jgi:hypothetical protein
MVYVVAHPKHPTVLGRFVKSLVPARQRCLTLYHNSFQISRIILKCINARLPRHVFQGATIFNAAVFRKHSRRGSLMGVESSQRISPSGLGRIREPFNAV